MNDTTSMDQIASNSLTRARTILVFELRSVGHFGYFIKYLADFWSQWRIPAHLEIVVAPEFFHIYPDVVELGGSWPEGSVRFHQIADSEIEYYANDFPLSKILNSSRLLRTHARLRMRRLLVWQLIKNYITRLHADKCLLLSLDEMAAYPALDPHIPCELAGIYFYPQFHYGSLGAGARSMHERLRDGRQLLTLLVLLARRSTRCVFILDPYAVSSLQCRFGLRKVVHLPEPVRLAKDHETVLSSSDLFPNDGRRVFLLLGAIAERRGTTELLTAIEMLPDEVAGKARLLIVGPTTARDPEGLKEHLNQRSAVNTNRCSSDRQGNRRR